MTDIDQNAPEPSRDTSESRRDFLYYATAGAGAVATGAAVWPLVNSMNPSADVLSLSTVEIDLSSMQRGQRITVSWQGKPVFVWRRSQEAIDIARATPLDALIDQTDSAKENPNQPQDVPALDQNRTADEAGEWLIVIGICTHLGCVPVGQGSGDALGLFGGWFCPCHGSHYDTSGRIRKGPAPRNLDIPRYTLADDLMLTIGA